MRRKFLSTCLVVLAVTGSSLFSGALQAQTSADGEAAGAGTKLASASKLVWQKDLQSSLEMARRSKKLVLVDVYTDWCGWCHKLDRDTYSNPEVIAFVDSQFVCLKLDAEDGSNGERFAQKHKVTGYPCTMVLDPSGQRLGGFYGYRSAKQFADAVKQAVGKS